MRDSLISLVTLKNLFMRSAVIGLCVITTKRVLVDVVI